MATNEFLTFAADAAANVMIQSDYADPGFTQRLLGFSTGTAFSIQLNKVWRQSSLITSMIGQFTVDQTGQDMLDDGSPGNMTNLQTRFTTAVRNAVLAGGIGNFLPLTGGTLTGQLTIHATSPQFVLQATTGQSAYALFEREAGKDALIGGFTGISPRWLIDLADSAPETGGNLGSNFDINRYSDTGQYLDTPLSISRATGVVNFSHVPTIAGGDLPYLRITGGTVTGYVAVVGVGISYPNQGGHYIAYGWDGANGILNAFVDGTYIGGVATQQYVGAVVGGYLPLTGGWLSGQLNINAALIVYGVAGFYSSVYFGGTGDFANYIYAGVRYRTWAGNYYDYLDPNSGFRAWVNGNGSAATLSPNADLASNSLRATYGRVISQASGGVPTLCAWYVAGSAATGLWTNTDGLWLGGMDGSGNPTAGWLRLTYDGVLWNWGGIITYNWLQVTSWATIGGNLSVSGRCDVYGNNIVAHGGGASLTIDNNALGVAYGMWVADQGGGHGVVLSFGRMDSNGNPTFLCGMMDGAQFWYARGFVSYSARSLKQDIQLSPDFDSLAAIRAVHTYSYRWRQDRDISGKVLEDESLVPARSTTFGFIADDVEAAMPDAVTGEPDLGAIDTTAMLAHAFRAIDQLAARIEALEGK